jgi:hypothetical protein
MYFKIHEFLELKFCLFLIKISNKRAFWMEKVFSKLTPLDLFTS